MSPTAQLPQLSFFDSTSEWNLKLVHIGETKSLAAQSLAWTSTVPRMIARMLLIWGIEAIILGTLEVQVYASSPETAAKAALAATSPSQESYC